MAVSEEFSLEIPFSCRYTVHVLIGELHYACLTSKSDCPSVAANLESYSQVFLEKLRSVYRELPILADLSRDLSNLAVIDLSKPLKKIVVRCNVKFHFSPVQIFCNSLLI